MGFTELIQPGNRIILNANQCFPRGTESAKIILIIVMRWRKLATNYYGKFDAIKVGPNIGLNNYFSSLHSQTHTTVYESSCSPSREGMRGDQEVVERT